MKNNDKSDLDKPEIGPKGSSDPKENTMSPSPLTGKGTPSDVAVHGAGL